MAENQPQIFDCDVHQTYAHQSELYPYLESRFLKRVQKKGLGYPASPYTSSLSYKRADATPPKGTAGSDRAFLSQQLFDEMGITRAVLNGQGILSLSHMPETTYPAALAWAYNRWLIHDWLEADDRFYGSLQIALQDPLETAKMIRELGAHPRIVQVVAPSMTPLPLTHPYYDAIVRAVADMDLVLAIHPWQPAITTPVSAPYGNPTSYIEWRTLAGMPNAALLVSIVLSGMLEKYRGLRCLFLEGGFSWVPFFMWRMDQLYKSFRKDAPWLKTMPSEYLLANCRFGTQPIEEPPQQEYMHQIVDMMHAQQTLVYASDYPHWDADNPAFAMRAFSSDVRSAIFYDNASTLYGLA